MPNTTQIADILFKKQLGLGTTQSGRAFFEEPVKGRPFVVPSQIWTQADSIPLTAPASSSGVIQKLTQYQLTGVVGTSNSFTGALLVDAIPFNYGDGTSYNYSLFDSLGGSIAFGVNDWAIDTEAGIFMFNNGVPSNMPPTISFFRYSGQKGLTGSFIGTGQTGNFVTTSQTGSFVTTSQTGSFVTTSQTGGFVSTGQTGQFYPSSNPNGYISGVTNVGIGSGVFSGIVGNNAFFRSISGGSGIFVSGNAAANTLVIIATGVNGGGEVNTASNLPNGIGIFSGKVGSDLQFYSITGVTGIGVSLTSGLITINLTNTGQSRPFVFGSYNLPTGDWTTGFIPFGYAFATPPQVIGSVVDNSGDAIVLYNISGISTTGFYLSASDSVTSPNYYFHYLATTGTGFGALGTAGGGIGGGSNVDTGSLTGAFYPLNANPSGYLTSYTADDQTYLKVRYLI